MGQLEAEARLEEIENRLREIEAKLLEAADRAAIAGRIRAKIEAQLQSVNQMLEAIHAHAAEPRGRAQSVDVHISAPE